MLQQPTNQISFVCRNEIKAGRGQSKFWEMAGQWPQQQIGCGQKAAVRNVFLTAIDNEQLNNQKHEQQQQLITST